MSVVTQGLGSIRLLTGGYSEAFANPIPLAPPQRWQDPSNRYSLENLSAPYEEPVTLAEMKNHLRVDLDDTDDDALILSLITSARVQAENICRRVFVTSTWRFSMDHFPVYGDFAPFSFTSTFGAEMIPGSIRSAGPYSRGVGEFPIPLSPIQSIDSITYLDNTGSVQFLTRDQWEADTVGFPAILLPAFGTSWPATRNGRYAVRIAFTAGYGDASQIPAPIKSWIKIQAATEYRNREGVALFRGTIQELSFFDRLLDPFRLYEF